MSAVSLLAQVLNAQLCGDRPTESDSTLYPSDHIGIKVTLRISPKTSSSSGVEGDEKKGVSAVQEAAQQ